MDIINSCKTIFTYQQLFLIGLFLEITGAFFLAIESFGNKRLDNLYNKIIKFSSWARKSPRKLGIIIIPFFCSFTIGFFFNIKFLLIIFFPIYTVLIVLFLLMDHTDFYFDWIKRSSENRRIGPIGFIILSIGFIFQFIGQIIEMMMK